MLLVLALILLSGLLVFRLRSTPFDWAKFFAVLTHVDWLWLGVAIALILLSYVGRAVRWQVMLLPICPTARLRRLISATVVGFTAIVLLGRAGELVRPYLIAVKEKVSFSSQMAAWILERILDTILVLAIFGMALVWIPDRGLHLSGGMQWVIRAGGYIIAGLCALCFFFLIVFRNFSTGAQSRILAALAFLPEAPLCRVRETMSAFSEGMQSTRRPAVLALLIVYSLVDWFVIVAGYYALFHAFPATSQFSWADTLIFVGFVSLGSIVQIPGIGGGFQVATIAVLSEIFGLKLEAASGLAILIWVLSWLIIVPFGLLVAFHEGMNWNRFKHLPQDIPAVEKIPETS